MADIPSLIEMLENRWMRAWVTGDSRTLKSLTSRKFRMVMGSKPCAILDASSWLAAASSSFQCTSYRFGDIYSRQLGQVAIFATQLEMKATMLSGRLGAPLMFHCVHRNVSAPSWFDSRMAVGNSAVHEFDIARWMLDTELTGIQVSCASAIVTVRSRS